VTGVDVVEAAHDGDEEAIGLLRVLGERLGIGVASAINLFDPEEVVIGGGAARAGELLVGPARETARGYVLTGVGERTQIRVARHGVQAGVYGAALLALQESD
jgi:glucokinase